MAGKIKRALKLLFGTADVSVYEVAGEHWVSPDELRWARERRHGGAPALAWGDGLRTLGTKPAASNGCRLFQRHLPSPPPCPIRPLTRSGKAEEEVRRAVKGKAKVGEAAPVPTGLTPLSRDSAWSIDQQQRQAHYQQPPAVEERLRQVAATVLGAGCPGVTQTIDKVYCAPAAGGGSSGQHSRRPSNNEQGVELAAVVTHGGPAAGPGPSSGSSGSGSGAWDTSLGLSSSGARGYAPDLGGSAAGSSAAAGPSSSRAACPTGSGGW